MLYWQANFQIPNSGVQVAEVYITSELNEEKNKIIVNYYGDFKCENYLFSKEINISESFYSYRNLYDYLLSLEEFSNYKIA